MDVGQLRTWGDFLTQENYLCPACRCRKSGDVVEANSHDECCEVLDCPCHNEDL
jgi:hypothetical protein